jgi:hypothetical protein
MWGLPYLLKYGNTSAVDANVFSGFDFVAEHQRPALTRAPVEMRGSDSADATFFVGENSLLRVPCGVFGRLVP